MAKKIIWSIDSGKDGVYWTNRDEVKFHLDKWLLELGSRMTVEEAKERLRKRFGSSLPDILCGRKAAPGKK